jgi:hypothetical protein
VATVLLIKEADKLSLGQELHIKVPHVVISLMNSYRHQFLSNSHLVQYHSLLYKNPRITLDTVWLLNPDTFLPSEDVTMTMLRSQTRSVPAVLICGITLYRGPT